MAASVESEVFSALHAATGARRSLRSAQQNERRAVVMFIDRARAACWSWTRIGEALGISEVAARRYYERNRKNMRGMGRERV